MEDTVPSVRRTQDGIVGLVVNGSGCSTDEDSKRSCGREDSITFAECIG